MNRIGRAILICYALAVTLACAWVPWRGPVSGNLTKFLGYNWIWSGPTGPLTPEYYKLSTIDYGRMALELLALTALSGIAFLVTPGRTAVRTVTGHSPAAPTTAGTSTDHPANALPGAEQQNLLTIKASERRDYRAATWPRWRRVIILTVKRILATWVLWAAADLIAAALISAAGVSKLSDDAQVAIWILTSLGLLVGCAKLSWAKIN